MSPQASIVRVIVTDDPSVLLLKPDPELRFVMGRFTPARYAHDRFGYLLPVEQRRAFDVFARAHSLHVIEGAPTPTDRPRPLPPTFRRQAEPTERELFERQAVNRRGATLCRLRLVQARLVAARDRGQT